ncbi:nose resistant to fluoxetine protein 6-like isoform X4 [Daphnia pulicaria]|nr:nose resistant to fluoxetine protein 6-like isoform X4 [Daphnia pulicaria]
MYKSSGRLVENLIYIEGDENEHHESGLFDECLTVQSDGVSFQGKYCTVFFGLHAVENTSNQENKFNAEKEKETIYSNQMPSVGFCLPSTCTADDLNSAVTKLLGSRVIKGRNFSVVALANENDCYTEKKVQASSKFDNITVTILSVFGLLALSVTTATLHDSITDNVVSRNSFAVRLLHCFSAKRNCKTLLSTEVAKDSLSCVHGIRVLSTCWIVLFHIGGSFVVLRTIYNKQTFIKNAFQWEFQFLSNGFFAVDTFFLMSGLLVAFTQLRELDQNKGFFNLKKFYVRRYIRLTPVYAIILAFLAKIGSHVATGPNWNVIQRISKCTRENWWMHLLYVNNFMHPYSISSPDYAFGESWYLACDMQMFLISPLFIYPIWRWKGAGLIWTAICLFVFLGTSASVFIAFDLIPTLSVFRPSFKPKMDTYYDKHYTDTTARIPPYLIGILLGWLLHTTKGRKIYINKYLVAAGWITATLLGLIVTYGMFPYLDESTVPIINPFIVVSYGVLHHSAWAITIGWIIFACTHGYGGIINRFLSWKLFLPFSRMSYAVYLIHVNLAISYGAQLRKPLYVSQLPTLTTSFGLLGLVFLFASVVTIMVEMPFLNLEKLLLPYNSKAPESKKENVADYSTRNLPNILRNN